MKLADLLIICYSRVFEHLTEECLFLFQVRLQVQSIDKPLYRGTFHCFQSIIRQESVSGVIYLYLCLLG